VEVKESLCGDGRRRCRRVRCLLEVNSSRLHDKKKLIHV